MYHVFESGSSAKAKSKMGPLCVVEMKWKKDQWIEDQEESERPDCWFTRVFRSQNEDKSEVGMMASQV